MMVLTFFLSKIPYKYMNLTKNQQKMGYIYIISNILDRRVYIGQTFRKPIRRWYGHINNLKYQNHNPKLQNFVNKYGIETLKFNILASNILGLNLLNYYEKFYIKLYNSFKNGFNCTEGGDSANPNRERKIIIKNILTNEIITFQSISECSRITGVNESSISGMLNGKFKQAGRMWCKPDASIDSTNLSIYTVINNRGEEFKVSHIYDFCENFNLSYTTFWKILKGGGFEHKGWRLKENQFKEAPTRKIKIKIININNKEIKDFNSLREFSKFVQVTDLTASGFYNGYQKKCKGWILAN